MLHEKAVIIPKTSHCHICLLLYIIIVKGWLISWSCVEKEEKRGDTWTCSSIWCETTGMCHLRSIHSCNFKLHPSSPSILFLGGFQSRLLLQRNHLKPHRCMLHSLGGSSACLCSQTLKWDSICTVVDDHHLGSTRHVVPMLYQEAF